MLDRSLTLSSPASRPQPSCANSANGMLTRVQHSAGATRVLWESQHWPNNGSHEPPSAIGITPLDTRITLTTSRSPSTTLLPEESIVPFMKNVRPSNTVASNRQLAKPWAGSAASETPLPEPQVLKPAPERRRAFPPTPPSTTSYS